MDSPHRDSPRYARKRNSRFTVYICRRFRSLRSRNGAYPRTRERENKGGGQRVPLPESVPHRPCFPFLPPRRTTPFRRRQEAEPPSNHHDAGAGGTSIDPHDVANDGTSSSQGHAVPKTLCKPQVCQPNIQCLLNISNHFERKILLPFQDFGNILLDTVCAF